MPFQNKNQNPGFPSGKFFDTLQWTPVKGAAMPAFEAQKTFPMGGRLHIIKGLEVSTAAASATTHGINGPPPGAATHVKSMAIMLSDGSLLRTQFDANRQANHIAVSVSSSTQVGCPGAGAERVFRTVAAELNTMKYHNAGDFVRLFGRVAREITQEQTALHGQQGLKRVRALTIPFGAGCSLDVC